jgi:glutamate dehydrogenase
VADDVAHDVLRNCYRQSLAVSLDEHRVRRNPVVFADALRHLEKGGFLDRHLEQLPTTEDLAERREQGRPVLTRPELSVLLAYAKLHLKGRLLESPVVDDPALLDLARTYFPARVMEAAGEETLGAHRLRANIAVTVLTNLLVDTMGSAGLIGLTRETQRHPADVAKAWYVACRVAGSEDLRSPWPRPWRARLDGSSRTRISSARSKSSCPGTEPRCSSCGRGSRICCRSPSEPGWAIEWPFTWLTG